MNKTVPTIITFNPGISAVSRPVTILTTTAFPISVAIALVLDAIVLWFGGEIS